MSGGGWRHGDKTYKEKTACESHLTGCLYLLTTKMLCCFAWVVCQIHSATVRLSYSLYF